MWAPELRTVEQRMRSTSNVFASINQMQFGLKQFLDDLFDENEWHSSLEEKKIL